MFNKNSQKTFILASITILIAACGGGGSGTSTTSVPVVTTCSNGATNYPTCNNFTANLQLTVPTPPFANGSDLLNAFNFLNDERAALGLGKIAYNEALTKAADAHTNYMFLNKWLDHSETETMQGFTGATPVARANRFGYASNIVGEDLGLANSLVGGVKNLLGTVYHRSSTLSQGWRDVGLSSHCHGQCTDTLIFYTFNFGYKEAQRNASDFVFTYPRNGQKNVRPDFCGESPWPLNGMIAISDACKVKANPVDANNIYDAFVGYPISVTAAEGRQLTADKFTLYEGSVEIKAWILDTKTDPNKILGTHEIYLVPQQSLKLGTVYTGVFNGKSDGVPISLTWTFTTDTVQSRQD